MANIGNMWFRTGTNAWVAKANGKLVTLAKGKDNEETAKLEYAKLVVKVNAESEEDGSYNDRTSIKIIFGLYKDHFTNINPPKTLLKKHRYFDMFVKQFGERSIKDLKAHNIQDWFDTLTTWNSTTKLWVLRMYNHVFTWALKREYITRNPIASMDKPVALVRGEDVVISDDNYAKVRAAASPRMQLILDALWYTGSRPSEILTAHASEYNKDAAVLDKSKHKTAGKGVKRKIALPPNIVKLVEAQIAKNPNGYLFPTKTGKTLSSSEFYNRLQALKRKAKVDATVIPYGFRHSYACKLILAGVPDVHVATLLGHTSTKHLHRNYAHTLAMAKGMSTSLDMVLRVMSQWQEKEPTDEDPASSSGEGQKPAA